MCVLSDEFIDFFVFYFVKNFYHTNLTILSRGFFFVDVTLRYITHVSTPIKFFWLFLLFSINVNVVCSRVTALDVANKLRKTQLTYKYTDESV